MDAVTVYGTEQCRDTQRVRQHLEKIGIPYRFINIDDNRFAEDQVKQWNGGRRKTPTLVLATRQRETKMATPSNEEVDRELGYMGIKPQRQWGELAK